MQRALTLLVAMTCVTAGIVPAHAKGKKHHHVEAAIAEPIADAPTGPPAYRFPSYRGDGAPPLWGYLFGATAVVSPAFNYYAPGYQPGPASGAAPTGRYYASPCYVEPQQVWDGSRLYVTRVRICR